MLINLIVSVVVGVVTALATTYLTFRRFRAEKLWEKKVDAYVRLINAAHEMQQVRDAEISALKSGNELSGDPSKALWKESKEAKRTILRLADTASFLMTDEVQTATLKLVEDLEQALESGSWDTWLDLMQQEQTALSIYLRELKAIARRELHI